MDNVFHPRRDRASVILRLILMGRSTSGVHPGRPHLQLHKPPAFTFLYLLPCTLFFLFSQQSRQFFQPLHTDRHTHTCKKPIFWTLMLLQSHLWIHNAPCRIPPPAFFPALIPQSPLRSTGKQLLSPCFFHVCYCRPCLCSCSLSVKHTW